MPRGSLEVPRPSIEVPRGPLKVHRPGADAPEVDPDLLAVPSCPRCGAGLRGRVQWCTQCYLDLRPAPEPAPVAAPVPVPAPVTAPVVLDPLTAPLAELLGTDARPQVPRAAAAEPGAGPALTWPCTCGTANRLDLDACTACGAGFLADVRADEAPLLTLPGVGDVARLGRARSAALAGAFVLAVVLLVALSGLLLG